MTRSKKTAFISFLLICCFIISTCIHKLEKVMEVSTGTVNDIKSESATATGTIIDLGEGANQYGHFYAKTPNSNIAGQRTQIGVPVGTGNFSSNLIDLEPGTKYYVRAYLNDGNDTVYGKEISFYTISASPPTVSTTAASSITNTTATLNGTVNANGCSTVITFEYGLTVSYGLTLTAIQSPVDGTTLTSVSADITGLISGQTYHYRVKAVNAGGTVYGGDMLLTSTVNDKDGNIYNIVTIGMQVWMKENLKTTKYNDGTSIPNVTTDAIWAALTTPAYCWYNNDATTYKNTYGALYNWFAGKTGNLCPAGWHVPSSSEWTTFENYIIATGYNYDGTRSGNKYAIALASTTLWTYSTNTGAVGNTDYPSDRNATGFTALPGGFRFGNGPFTEIGNESFFWSSSMFNTTLLGARQMVYSGSNFNWVGTDAGEGFSVRCLRDVNANNQ